MTLTIPTLFDVYMGLFSIIGYWLMNMTESLLNRPVKVATMVMLANGQQVTKPEGFIHWPCVHHTVVPITQDMDEQVFWEHARLRDFDDLSTPILVIKYHL